MRHTASTSKKSVIVTSKELGARAAAGKTRSDWAWIRTREPDLTDADAPDFSGLMRTELKSLRGRPAGSGRKDAVSLRVDRDVLAGFRATGRGWQTRMNAALRAWLETQQARAKRQRARKRKPAQRTGRKRPKLAG
ncbi:MAG: BrnA antitoxin family protein [Coriobacteriia bacterium]